MNKGRMNKADVWLHDLSLVVQGAHGVGPRTDGAAFERLLRLCLKQREALQAVVEEGHDQLCASVDDYPRTSRRKCDCSCGIARTALEDEDV